MMFVQGEPWYKKLETNYEKIRNEYICGAQAPASIIFVILKGPIDNQQPP